MKISLLLALCLLLAGCVRWPGVDQHEHRQPIGPVQTAPGW